MTITRHSLTEVKRSKVKVTWLSNALPACVCMSIGLLEFSGLTDDYCVCRIRVKKKEGTYALSLSYNHETKHYKVDQRKKDKDNMKFAIQQGPEFDNLMDVRGTVCRLKKKVLARGRTDQK